MSGRVWLLLAALLVGIATVLVLVRKVTMIDFASGDIKVRTMIGSIVVSESDAPPTAFESIQTKESSALRAKSEWHPALIFTLFSQQSPNLSGGRVLNDTTRIGTYAGLVDHEKLSLLKTTYLKRLAEKGPSAATEVVNDFESAFALEMESTRKE